MNALTEETPPSTPEWLLTYGDLMSLLLTFFIMLVAMCDWNRDDRVVQAVEAIQRQFGRDAEDPNANGRQASAPQTGPIGARPWLRAPGAGRNAAIGGSIIFAEDSADLSTDEQAQLRALADRLQGKGQRIEIRGHTTRRPLSPDDPYGDHWTLAFARCREVQRRLEAAGIAPQRLRLSLAAGNEPAYVGNDPLGTRENSRVDVFLLDEFAGPNESSEINSSPAEKLR